MGAQLQQAYNQGAMQQGNDYNTSLGQYFNQTTPTSPYWGEYTEPMNINPNRVSVPTQSTSNESSNPVLLYPSSLNYNNSSTKKSEKQKAQESFDNPRPLPNYSMYIAPDQMPDVNAYLYSPNSLLGAMQGAGITSSGAGRFANLLSTNNYTGK
jgi:hypothetical protein